MTNPSGNLEHQKTAWYIDSGATAHRTHDRSAFISYESINPFPVQMGDSSSALAVGKGTVRLRICKDNKLAICDLRDVLYVPSFVYSLISVPTLANRGLSVEISATQAKIFHNRQIVATGTRNKGLYVLDLFKSPDNRETALASASLQLWHERLGHVHKAGIQDMAKNEVVKGMNISTTNPTPEACEACIAGKMHRTPIPRASTTRADGLLDLVHTDVAGPLPVPSKGGALYFVTFIDDRSRWLTVYPIKSKSDCFPCFLMFRSRAETQTGRKIKAIRSDGGGEYLSNEFKNFLVDKGIHHQRTCSYTPQQNGVAERMNRTLKDLVRAMLKHMNIANEFWAEALSTAAYIRNRVTSRSLPKNKTPFHIWFKKAPDLSHLRVFGSKCWYKENNPNLGSLDSRAREALMLGYAANQKAYKLRDTNKGEIAVSRDVVFNENGTISNECKKRNDIDIGNYNEDPSDDYVPSDESGNSEDSEEAGNTASEDPTLTETVDGTEEFESANDTGHADEGISEPHESPALNRVSPARFVAGARRSLRQRRQPGEWWKATALSSVAAEDPLSFSAATKGENAESWLAAIKTELDAIEDNKTWTLVPRTEADNILTSKWVFKCKEILKADGKISKKYRARLVSRGFQQKEGIDYHETYAPVVKFTTLRMFLSLVAHLDLHCHQMDVKTAFLNGDLEQDVYMEQPEGCIDPERPDYVCKLEKALYGLKQAPRQWFAKINSFLTRQLKFKSSPYDPCLYYYNSNGKKALISLYVDDLLLAASDLNFLQKIKQDFCKRFKMEDCGEASVCLGLEIHRNRSKKTLHVSQSRYAEKVLKRFGMESSKPVVTPMDKQLEQQDIEGEPVESSLYRQAIGCLMYLAVGTRPDIAFAVSRLAQFVEHPTHNLWVAVKRVLRYISGTRDLGIEYSTSESLSPVGFSDSDWGGCKINRKSTTGYAFTMAGGAISWKSKKQGCVAQSSSEAEYMALSSAVKEAIWLSKIFDLTTSQSDTNPIAIFVDNQAAIKMSKNDTSSTRTKHIDIQYHFVRDALRKHLFTIVYCPTNDMAADILTKPLQRVLQERFRLALGLRRP